MITIVSGSNRMENKTLPFAKYAHDCLSHMGYEVKLLDLSALSGDLISSSMYDETVQPKLIAEIQNEFFIPALKFWFFVPEYNGSYPGIVKMLIDVMSVRDQDATFRYKKACLTGIALGRAGNLRGMDHLAEVLNHLNILIHPGKKPISSIYQFLDDNNELKGEEIKSELDKQIQELINFN